LDPRPTTIDRQASQPATPPHPALGSVPSSRAECLALDAADPLAGLRARFDLPRGLIYLDGNSLGPLSHAVRQRMAQVLEAEWGNGLIRSWNEAGWIDLSQRAGDRIARLIGARPGEVVVADSTSINLYKLLVGALRMRPERRVIVTEAGNFPTDLYMAQAAIELLGQGHRLRPVAATADLDTFRAVLDDDCAVLMLTQVDYRSGRLHDMAALTRMAQECGALVIWDLAHSAGALPVDLNAAGADLAVGCGYKYLNGGPGAPAFLYVAERHQADLPATLSGWLGHARPFAFEPEYQPAPGILRQVCGTPPILSLSALDAALEIWDAVDLPALRWKSQALGQLFIELVERDIPDPELRLISPREPALRGSQVAFSHPGGYGIIQALIQAGIIGDFREPDVLRFGLAPLYIRYSDVWDAVRGLAGILADESWRRPEFAQRAAVT
jgi:kynureninase